MIIRMFLLVFFYLQCIHANVTITDETHKYTDFTISYHYDETGTLSIDDISNSEFTQNIPSQFTLGYTDKNIWFKLNIENKSKTNDFVLYFTEPFWDKFNFYEQTSEGWQIQKAGLLSPLDKRKIEDASPAFPLTINTGESKNFYVNGQTVNGYLGAFEVYTNKEFFRPSRVTLTTFYQFYSGVLFIIIILNFFLLIEMKERIYAYYIGYVSAFIVFISMFSSSYLYLGFSGWNHGLHTMGAIVFIFMALFSGAFLELDKYFPKIDKLFKLFPIIFVFFAILMGFNIPHFTLIFNIFAFIFITTLLTMAVKTWQMGKIKTHYYLIALIIYMPTMGMMALTFDALLVNNDFTRYTFLLGALIEIIFFSLILASRFHIAKYDKIRLQEELLAEKQKNEEYLEDEINRQRNELEDKSAIMLQQSRHAQMGEMISMIAHQWRQPLASISSVSIDLQMKLELDAFDLDSKSGIVKASEYFTQSLNKISSYVQNLTTTIDDFRNFYKPNKKTVNIRLVDVIKKSLDIMNPSIINENIHIIEEYNCKCKIDIHDNEMMQVILNILKNSQDNFKEKGIESPYIKIKTFEKDKRRIIEICDNGGGIPEDILDNIFDPYFSTKDEKNGTGLGLYMSKTIVEDHHNGKLRVENRDAGVCFIIDLEV